MIDTSARRADCPPWCVTDHATDDPSRPAPHYGEAVELSSRPLVSVFPGLSYDADLEVCIEAAVEREPGGWPVTWVCLSPDQAENLAVVLDAAGQDTLAILIRQTAAVIAAAR